MSMYTLRIFLICIFSLFTGSIVCAQSLTPETTTLEPTNRTPTTSGELNRISPEALEALKAKAVVINIAARIMNGNEVVWSADQKRVTVHGLSVSVRLESTNLLILAEITPYRLSQGVMLVIKSELWSRGKTDRTVQYFAGLKSATVNWNEPIYFYPLGASASDGQARISMEITVNHYQDSDN